MEKLVQDLRTRQQNLVQFGESSPTQFRRMSYDAGLGSISIPQSLYEEPQDFVPEDKHPEPDSDEESLLHRTESVYHDALTPQEYNIELGDEASTIKGDETHEEEPGSDEDGTEGSFSPSGSTSDLRTLQLTEQVKEVQRRTKLPTGVSGGQSSVFGVCSVFSGAFECRLIDLH